MEYSWSELLFLRWQGKLTREQEAAFSEWLKEHPERAREVEALSMPEDIVERLKIVVRGKNPEVRDKIRNKINEILAADENGTPEELEKAENSSKALLRYWRNFLRVAILVIMLTGAYFYFANKSQKRQEDLPAIGKNNSIQPGKKMAILQLSDGKQVNLDSMQNGVLLHDGVAITKDNSMLSYKIDGTKEAEGTELFNTLIIPRGATYQVILPDGSHVWLNAESSLRYPTRFTKERKIYLEGEAYCEIVHSGAPFEVELSSGETVQVLGTHFNVSNYRNEPASTVTLLEGSVKVTNKEGAVAKLKPGQQVECEDGKLAVRNVDPDDAISWHLDRFQFTNERMDVVIRQIERWYDVDIVMKGDFKRVYASMSRSSDIISLMEILKGAGITEYKIDKRQIFLTGKSTKN